MHKSHKRQTGHENITWRLESSLRALGDLCGGDILLYCKDLKETQRKHSQHHPQHPGVFLCAATAALKKHRAVISERVIIHQGIGRIRPCPPGKKS